MRTGEGRESEGRGKTVKGGGQEQKGKGQGGKENEVFKLKFLVTPLSKRLKYSEENTIIKLDK